MTRIGTEGKANAGEKGTGNRVGEKGGGGGRGKKGACLLPPNSLVDNCLRHVARSYSKLTRVGPGAGRAG